jgi:hypothetical protein
MKYLIFDNDKSEILGIMDLEHFIMYYCSTKDIPKERRKEELISKYEFLVEKSYYIRSSSQLISTFDFENYTFII